MLVCGLRVLADRESQHDIRTTSTRRQEHHKSLEGLPSEPIYCCISKESRVRKMKNEYNNLDGGDIVISVTNSPSRSRGRPIKSFILIVFELEQFLK